LSSSVKTTPRPPSSREASCGRVISDIVKR